MVRVAEEWLATCGGCEVTILDIGEPLLNLLPKLEFVHMPVIMDHKYYGQTGEKADMEIMWDAGRAGLLTEVASGQDYHYCFIDTGGSGFHDIRL